MTYSRPMTMLMTLALVVWLMSVALGSMSLVVANIYFAAVIGPSYFPGDAPVADLVLECALAALLYTAFGVFAAWAVFRHARSRLLRGLWKVGLGIMAVEVVGSVPVAAEVGKRQFGEWAELKQLLRQSEAQVLLVTGREVGRLSASEYERARAWFQEHPVHFRFRELPEPVKVRVMTALPPYVGVDFGKGQTAVFDLDTMLCTYAD